jgi:hypothetical protein
MYHSQATKMGTVTPNWGGDQNYARGKLKGTYHDEQSNDNRVTPCAVIASPLKRKEQGHDHEEGDDRTDPIDDFHAFPEGLAGMLRVDRGTSLEEEQDGTDGETNKRVEQGIVKWAKDTHTPKGALM